MFAILSDSCQSRLGKRKPFIFGGGAAVVLSLLLLARARELGELSSTFFSSTGVDTLLAKSIATISIYCLNFAMQPLYLGIRAWSVDFFLPHQQPVISLWSSRFMSLGSLFVAFVGYGSHKPSFESLAFVSAAVLTAVLLLILVAAPPDTRMTPGNDHRALVQMPISWHTHACRLMKKIQDLPPITRHVCRTQLLAWFAWFPILQYSSR